MLLERVGLRAEEAVHVGDDPEADVEGARAAGVLPVWLNREASAWPRSSDPPRIVITGLDELSAALPPAVQARSST
jgi:putative hydrolase of the HAD superfamily